MNKEELLVWINKELKEIENDTSPHLESDNEWWRGRDCGWEEALKEIKRIYYE